MKNLEIYCKDGIVFKFKGKYLHNRQQFNWHYYQDDKGVIYHIRKEHLIAVKEYSK